MRVDGFFGVAFVQGHKPGLEMRQYAVGRGWSGIIRIEIGKPLSLEFAFQQIDLVQEELPHKMYWYNGLETIEWNPVRQSSQ